MASTSNTSSTLELLEEIECSLRLSARAKRRLQWAALTAFRGATSFEESWGDSESTSSALCEAEEARRTVRVLIGRECSMGEAVQYLTEVGAQPSRSDFAKLRGSEINKRTLIVGCLWISAPVATICRSARVMIMLTMLSVVLALRRWASTRLCQQRGWLG